MRSLRINTKIILFIFVFIVFIYPSGLVYINKLDKLLSIFALCRYIISFLYIFKFFSSFKRNNRFLRLSSSLVVIMVTLMIISSLVNGTAHLTLDLSYLTILGLWCFVSYYLTYEYHSKVFINTLIYYLLVLLGLNLFSIILFPGGIVDSRVGFVYLLGAKNGISLYILLFLLLLAFKGVKRSVSVLVCALFVVFLVFQKAASGLGAISIYFVYSIYSYINKQNNKRVIRYISNSFLILLVLFFVFVVVGRKDFPLISNITSMLGRDVTFSGRTMIWPRAIEYITENPIWGVGPGAEYDVWNNSKYVYSAHNTFLDTAVSYGVPVLLFFLLVITSVLVFLFKYRKSKFAVDCIFILIGLIVVMMFEASEMDYLLWVIICCFFYLLTTMYKFDNNMR